jgi:hypothetical protein
MFLSAARLPVQPLVAPCDKQPAGPPQAQTDGTASLEQGFDPSQTIRARLILKHQP